MYQINGCITASVCAFYVKINFNKYNSAYFWQLNCLLKSLIDNEFWEWKQDTIV